MKLAEPPWFYLNQALDWLTDCGISEDDAKQRLYQAFRYREIEARGRCLKFFRHKNPATVPVDKWENAIIDWRDSNIFFIHELLGDTFIKEIELRREDLAKLIVQSETTSVSSTAGLEAKCRKWLTALMEGDTSPKKPKREYHEEANQKFGVVPKRMFDRAWANAIGDSGNKRWSQPGRKS